MYESLVSGVESATPGADAARVLDRDPATMSGAELVDAIAASERLLSAATAWQMRALAALAVPGVAGDPTDLTARVTGSVFAAGAGPSGAVQVEVAHAGVVDAAQSLAAGEVAAVLRISPVTAGVRVRDAVRMCTDLPATLQALASGVIDRGKARVIAEHTAPLPVHLCARVQGWVLPVAAEQSTAATRHAVAAAVIAVDPRGAQERHEQARQQRDLRIQPAAEGMSTLKAYLAADGAVSIFQLADLLATHTVGFADDPRSVGARRVDALTDLAGQILTHGQVDLADYLTPGGCDPTPPPTSISSDPTPPTGSALPAGSATPVGSAPDAGDRAGAGGAVAARATRRLSRQGRRPHLQVTLALSTLAGIDDLPAHLAGHGPITAALARTIATSAASLTTLLTDPTTGAVLTAGAHTYRPRQDLRDHLTALADSCRFPSCRQPTWRCDIDHHTPFDRHHPDRGGATTAANTDPLCRRHHLFKHHTGWTLHRDTPTPTDPAGQGVTWRSPTGHTYRDPARQAATPAAWTTQITDSSDTTDPDGITVLQVHGDVRIEPDPAGTPGGLKPVERTRLRTRTADAPHPASAAPTREALRGIPDALEHRHSWPTHPAHPMHPVSARNTNQGDSNQFDADKPSPVTDSGSNAAPGAAHTPDHGAPTDHGTPADRHFPTGTLEDDLTSLLVREHLVDRLAPEVLASESDSTTGAPGGTQDDDPPPF